MGGNGFIDSELLFSDTVHQFLQVLTMTLKEGLSHSTAAAATLKT